MGKDELCQLCVEENRSNIVKMGQKMGKIDYIKHLGSSHLLVLDLVPEEVRQFLERMKKEQYMEEEATDKVTVEEVVNDFQDGAEINKENKVVMYQGEIQVENNERDIHVEEAKGEIQVEE